MINDNSIEKAGFRSRKHLLESRTFRICAAKAFVRIKVQKIYVVFSGGHYIIEESEAKYVRMIFQMYAAGKSYNDIMAVLNGLRGKRGAVIGKSQLNSILKNERYIGIYTWNKKISTQKDTVLCFISGSGNRFLSCLKNHMLTDASVNQF